MQLFSAVIGSENDVESIIRSGANVDILDKELRKTPLHYAAKSGETIVFKILLLAIVLIKIENLILFRKRKSCRIFGKEWGKHQRTRY